MYVPEYWVLVGASSSTKQATKTTREGDDDEEDRSHSDRLIVTASSGRASIMSAEREYKYKYSTFRENNRNTEVLQKGWFYKKENWAESEGGCAQYLGINPQFGATTDRKSVVAPN